MDRLSKCHKVAVKQIVGAIGMLGSKSGSTARDIYFVLDNLHSKVQRHVIQHALKSAVSNGIIKYCGGRYKLTRHKKLKARSVTRQKSSVRRPKAIHSHSDGSFCSCNVRNYECKMVRNSKSKSRMSRMNSFSFREVKSLLACDCCSRNSSVSDASTQHSYSTTDVQPRRKRSEKHTKIKHYIPKQVSATCSMSEKNVNTAQEKNSDDDKNELEPSPENKVKEDETNKSNDKSKEKISSSDTETGSPKSSKSNESATGEKNTTQESDSVDEQCILKSCASKTKKVSDNAVEKCSYLTRSRAKTEEEKKKECRYMTRSKARIGREKRCRSKSSKSLKTSNKQPKRDSRKSVTPGKKSEENKDSGNKSSNYDHLYS